MLLIIGLESFAESNNIFLININAMLSMKLFFFDSFKLISIGFIFLLYLIFLRFLCLSVFFFIHSSAYGLSDYNLFRFVFHFHDVGFVLGINPCTSYRSHILSTTFDCLIVLLSMLWINHSISFVFFMVNNLMIYPFFNFYSSLYFVHHANIKCLPKNEHTNWNLWQWY